jgi:hypothetical protein
MGKYQKLALLMPGQAKLWWAEPSLTPPHYRTTRESFPLTWLFRVWAIIIGTVCRERRRGSVRAAVRDSRGGCSCDCRRDGAIPSLGWQPAEQPV